MQPQQESSDRRILRGNRERLPGADNNLDAPSPFPWDQEPHARCQAYRDVALLRHPGLAQPFDEHLAMGEAAEVPAQDAQAERWADAVAHRNEFARFVQEP